MRMVGIVMPSQISRIGTDSYFEEITRGTIFAGITVNDTGDGFARRLNEIASRAGSMLTVIDNDIAANQNAIKFMSQQEINLLSDLIDNLSAAAAFLMGPVRTNANMVKQRLNSSKLPPGTSMYQVEDAAKAITGSPFCSAVTFQDKERVAAVKARLNSPFPSFGSRQTFGFQQGFGLQQNTDQFLDQLFDKFDKETLSAALDYIDFRSKTWGVTGQNGEVLGSDRYRQAMAAEVFGDDFARTASASSFGDFAGIIRQQTNQILDKIRQDVWRERTDVYMEYETRQKMIKVTGELAKIGTGQALTENDLSKLRRLEGFDNNVIEISRTGSQYPVQAELKWESGKNVLYLTAKVYYESSFLLGKLEAEKFTPPPMPSFPELRPPDPVPGPGPDIENYNSMMAGYQAARAEYERQWRDEVAKLERQWENEVAALKREIEANNNKRKRAVEDEFKTWGKPGYTVFGGQKVDVNVEIKEVFSASSDAVTIYLDSPTGRAMSWGGVTKNIIGLPGLGTTVSHIIDWKPDTPKVIFMSKDSWKNGSFGGVARHEFGHSLGLGDAYVPNPNLWPIYGGPGVDPTLPALSGLPLSGNGLPELAMNWNTQATDIEIEMVILAFATGQRQNFASQAYYQSISDALK